MTLYQGNRATLDDLHEAVHTLEGLEPIARRVLGGAHPICLEIEDDLRRSRALLAIRKMQPSDAA